MAQGGAFSAQAEGYTSLFTNPAGFALGKGDITFLSTTAWIYANPARLSALIDDATAGNLDVLDAINTEITNGGIGLGSAIGFGYVKKGLGLGLSVITDAFLIGDNAFGTEGTLTTTIGFVGGYAFPIDLGFGKLTVGADVRPMFRVHSELSAVEAVSLYGSLTGGEDFMAVLANVQALHGFGLGFDAGAILTMGNFNISLAMRDLFGGYYFYRDSTWGELIEQGLEAGEYTDTKYVVPCNVIVGAAWHPDLGKFAKIIDPVVMLDVQDMIAIIQDGRSFWTTLHIGAEVTFFRFIAIRGGLNQGYITFGCGLDLFIFDLNFAMFTRELGKFLQDQPNSGMSLEVAFRL
jgi:hypothetical protein